jgi:prevent-host-death family protein
MRPIQLSKDVVSLGELKVQASRILARVKKDHRPIVITQHGKPAGVLISPEEFDTLAEHARFMEAVRHGLDDSEQGRLVDDAELDAEIGRVLKTKRAQ